MIPVRGQPFNSHDFMAIRLYGKDQAGAHGGAIEQDRTGAADTVLTAYMRAGQPQLVAKKVTQQQTRLHLALVFPAINF